MIERQKVLDALNVLIQEKQKRVDASIERQAWIETATSSAYLAGLEVARTMVELAKEIDNAEGDAH